MCLCLDWLPRPLSVWTAWRKNSCGKRGMTYITFLAINHLKEFSFFSTRKSKIRMRKATWKECDENTQIWACEIFKGGKTEGRTEGTWKWDKQMKFSRGAARDGKMRTNTETYCMSRAREKKLHKITPMLVINQLCILFLTSIIPMVQSYCIITVRGVKD